MVFDVRHFKTVTDVRFDVVPFVNCAISEAVFKQYLVCAWWHFQVFMILTHLKMFIQFNLENRRCDLFSGSLIALSFTYKIVRATSFWALKIF